MDAQGGPVSFSELSYRWLLSEIQNKVTHFANALPIDEIEVAKMLTCIVKFIEIETCVFLIALGLILLGVSCGALMQYLVTNA